MNRFSTLSLTIIIMSCAVMFFPATGQACSLGSVESSDPKLLISRADAIVRAVAVTYNGEYLDGSGSGKYFYSPLIEFKILEVLKGENIPDRLHISGSLTTKDDFNDPQMSLYSIRPSGRGGSCYAREYKKDGEFLLFLKRRGSELTPYWASMAATNQQLHQGDDAWLMWVRNQLNGDIASHNAMQPTANSVAFRR